MVSKRKEMIDMLKKIIMAVMLTVTIAGFGEAAPKWVLIHDVHNVVEGESIDSIAQVYMEKNTYGPREFVEFREGIIELNDLRGRTEVHPGQKLKINYWVTPEDVLNR